MPLRNPFRKTVDISDGLSQRGFLQERGPQNGNTGPTTPIEIKEPVEYKLSEINDSGVFLPPSPPEKPPFRHTRSSGSFASSNHRSILSENEPFNMSRESFDSYRRSFDISARSSIPEQSALSRQSLDSSFRPRIPRSSPHKLPPSRSQQDVPEEALFEDIGLNDENMAPPRRRGLFFSRFGESAQSNAAQDGRLSSNSGHGFLFVGRKRGISGQGSELKTIIRPAVKTTEVDAE